MTGAGGFGSGIRVGIGIWISFGLAVSGYGAGHGTGAGPVTGTAIREPVTFTQPYRDGLVLIVWGNGYSDPQLDAMFDRISRTGSTHLTLPVFGCQSDIHASDVGGCELSDRAYTLHVATLAKAHGYDVTFLPIVGTPDWQWRGFFEPADVGAWFASYTAWIRKLGADAEALGHTEFVVGSEFSKLYANGAEWKKVLGEVRTVFHGPLILTVNWGDTEHDFWNDADAIGISAYYPLSQSADPTQDELDRAWARQRDELLAISRRYQRPLHLTELGYPSTAHAAATPWQTPEGSAADAALQARCYQAFSRAWQGERGLVRAGFWATSDLADESAPFSFEMLDKPAEAILTEFFRLRALLP